MGPLHKSPPYFIPSTSNGPSRLSARSRLNKRRRRRRNQCPHLSGENEPRMEFIDGDQLRRGGVEAGGQAGQRVVALDRVGQRVLRQAAVAAATDAAASARSPFTDAHRTTGTSSAVCNNKKRRNKNQSISCTIEKSLWKSKNIFFMERIERKRWAIHLNWVGGRSPWRPIALRISPSDGGPSFVRPREKKVHLLAKPVLWGFTLSSDTRPNGHSS